MIGISAGLLSLVTVLGNLMVMISFKMDKQLQTISNYFLFSLAVADMIIGTISMPLFTVFIIQQKWTLGRVVCDSWLSVDYLASNSSVLNLLVISFDRWEWSGAQKVLHFEIYAFFDNFLQVLFRHPASHLSGQEDDEEGRADDLLGLGHLGRRLAALDHRLALHRGQAHRA